MSRPCFALSVMLCCMAGPLLVIGKTQAQDTTVSPSHDPGECIVCPLAYGPFDACGGYSDYDYNKYWSDDNSPAASEAAPPADPELEVAQSLTDDATDEAWESGYEDYYADYAFGDDSNPTYEEDMDEAARAEDYFDAYDSYEPIAPAQPDTAARDYEAYEEDYEAYEEEWFSYGSETNVEAEEVTELAADEAYEALSESASEAYSDEILDTESVDSQFADEAWGDEEEWYREEYGYGYEDVLDEEIVEPSADIVPVAPLGIGYDEAYDAAMATDGDTADPVAENVPVATDTHLPVAENSEADYYESYYDAYDGLYNFESTPTESCPFESSIESLEPEVYERARQAADSEPAWLTELVNRMLAPVWTAAGGVASNTPLLSREFRPAIYEDECAQEWDCEADYWARPQPEQPSVVLQAADTLDGMASLLQDAAEALRAVAGGHLAETAQTATGGAAR